jgi:Homeodomain-like domain
VIGHEHKRAHACALRAHGLTITQISDRLGVPRSTVGGWLLGEGEWFDVRDCQLCGERFIPASPRQVFCCRQHASKYKRIYGSWQRAGGYRADRKAA